MTPQQFKIFTSLVEACPDGAKVGDIAVALVHFVAAFATHYAKNKSVPEFLDAFAQDTKDIAEMMRPEEFAEDQEDTKETVN